MYARTDVGGLYRWDADNKDWHQLLSVESVGQKVSLAVESVAIDPNNTNIVYAATGAFTHTGKGKRVPGSILKSTDKGNTWQVLDLALPVGGNEEWRWTGERLAVDPHDSNVVYFGSRVDGLWRSQDGGNSWSQIDTDSVPVGKTWGETKGVPGVTFIEFDRSSPGVVYVGVAGEGVYQTTNGGKSWQSLGEIAESLIPQQGEVNADGELVVTLFDRQNKSSNGGIWKFNGSTWEDVTPKTGKNYVGLTVNDSNPNTLFAVTYPMTPKDIYRSTDGGETWSVANQNSPLPKGAWTGVSVKTLPGVEGEVWAGFEDKGLYRSSNGGETFTQIEGVEYVDGFGFGKSAPNTDNPTLFVSGTIEGSMGVFGSTDLGDSWSQVSNLPNQFLGDVRSVTGDMNTFGRVYLGVESNGFIYGDL